MPIGWFEYIKSLIQGRSFFRYDTVVTINLKLFDGWKGAITAETPILLEQEISFEVENVSRATGDLTYDIAVYIEKPFEDRFLSRVQLNEMVVGDHKLSPEELRQADSGWADGKFLKKFSKKITIGKGSRVRVYTRCTTVKYARDHFVWASIHPSQGIEVICRPPEGIMAFVSLLHPESLGEDPATVEPGARGARRVDNPVIPGTCAEFAWRPVSIFEKMAISDATSTV